MTLQQLDYVLAIDEYHQFVKAAESRGITQSTLSSMIKKLEEELDLVIFDRNSHPVRPTEAGQAIIDKARIVLYHANQLKETVLSERKKTMGRLSIGITPTIAPCIIPKMFGHMRQHTGIDLHAYEMNRDTIIEKLKTAQLDMGIMSIAHEIESLLEIPLYTEEFVAYVSPHDPLIQQQNVDCNSMPLDRIWVLQHEISFQEQVNIFETKEPGRRAIYESGNIPTLLHLINANDGFTVLPELHVPLLRQEDQLNVRPLVNPTPTRRVSLFVRQDYVREGMLNIVADAIKTIIPDHMIDEHLAKYPIRL